jgi:hypothetical protein
MYAFLNICYNYKAEAWNRKARRLNMLVIIIALILGFFLSIFDSAKRY